MFFRNSSPRRRVRQFRPAVDVLCDRIAPSGGLLDSTTADGSECFEIPPGGYDHVEVSTDDICSIAFGSA